MDHRSSFLTTPVAVLIGAVLIAIAILISGGIIKIGTLNTQTATSGQTAQQPKASGQAAGTPTAPQKVDVSMGHLPIKGDNNAKVSVVEFADLRCPFCQRLFTQVEPNLIKDFVDTGKIKFAFRHYAFLGPASTVAANAAECANEQGKFWEMHDYLYQNQPSETDTSMYTVDKLTSIAGNLGMNTDQFKSCLSANKYDKNVTSDFNDGQKIGVNGTPATFIDGKQISGACPYDTFSGAIKAELDGKKWAVDPQSCQLTVQ